MLSGFLITSLLQAEFTASEKINISAFWIRRALKLLPPLIITIVIVNVFWKYFPENAAANEFIASVAGLLYFLNFIKAELLGPLSHLWSLSIEEHFYLFWPIIIGAGLLKQKRKFIAIAILIIIIFIGLLRVVCYWFFSNSFSFNNSIFIIDFSRNTLFRLDAILLGCGLSISFYALPNNKRIGTFFKVIVILFFLIALFKFDQTQKWLNLGGFVLVNSFCCLAIYIAFREPNNKYLTSNVMKFFGKRSYGIYLYHFPIFLLLENFRKNDNIPNLIIVTFLRFALTFIIAELSYQYIENPVLKFKKKFAVSKNG